MAARYTVIRGQDKRREHCLRFVANDGSAFSTRLLSQSLENELADLRKNIDSLIDSSIKGEKRLVDIIENSKGLRRQVFGDICLSHRIPLKPSLLFETDKYCATIEWELVDDQFVMCNEPSHQWTRGLWEGEEDWQYCPKGHPLISSKYPLGITKHLGVRPLQWNIPQHSYKPPNDEPTKVLIVGDPDGNLDVEEHLDLLQGFFSKGYIPVPMQGRLATRSCIRKALNDEAYAAIYVFAHGSDGDKNGPSHIMLRDGPLYAEDLPTKFMCQPLIFLNSCSVAKSEWLETVGATDSLAGEMLQRGASAVIGALCPIRRDQATRAALLFFHDVLLASTIGQAMARVRMDSYDRYVRGEADLSWFAYRLYGDPDRCLASRLWNADGTLRKGAFSFDPALLEKLMEKHRQQRGDSASTYVRTDMTSVAVNILTSGITAGVPNRLESLSVIWKKFTAMVGTVRKSAPNNATPGLISQSSEDLRLIFADLLRLHIERLQQAQQLNLNRVWLF